MKDDAVQQIQFDAMDALGWLNAKSACNDLVLLTKQYKKRILISRALTTLTDIKCSQAEPILLAYFESGKINKTGPYLTNTIFTEIARLKSTTFIPYLTKLTIKNNETNISVLITLQKIGGEKVISFLKSELNNSNNDSYKNELVKYLLKINNPISDRIVVDYINEVSNFSHRRLIYYAFKNELRNIKRRTVFTDRFIQNYKNESDDKSRSRIAYLLEGIIDVNQIKVLIKHEKNISNKCKLVKNLTAIATMKQYSYLIQFDSNDIVTSCRYPVIDFLGNLKNKTANNYLLSKYKSLINTKMLYLIAIGNLN